MPLQGCFDSREPRAANKHNKQPCHKGNEGWVSAIGQPRTPLSLLKAANKTGDLRPIVLHTYISLWAVAPRKLGEGAVIDWCKQHKVPLLDSKDSAHAKHKASCKMAPSCSKRRTAVGAMLVRKHGLLVHGKPLVFKASATPMSRSLSSSFRQERDAHPGMSDLHHTSSLESRCILTERGCDDCQQLDRHFHTLILHA